MNDANNSNFGSTHKGDTPQSMEKESEESAVVPSNKRRSRLRFRNLHRSSVSSVSPETRVVAGTETKKPAQCKASSFRPIANWSAGTGRAAGIGGYQNQLKTNAATGSEDAASKSAKLATAEKDQQRDSNDIATKEQRDPAAKDIFGDADDISEDDDKQPACEPNENGEPQNLPETRIDVVIPRIVADLGREITFAKLPNFLSIDTRPFDPQTYEDEVDKMENIDEDGRQSIKLKVSNTIRYREIKNEKGEIVRESNTRMVRWSDGSLSLHLGSEIIDVYKQPVLNDHNHLFVRQGSGLQGQSIFPTKLTFRPHSTESMTHKKIIMSLADRSQKMNGIKILTEVGRDPNSDRRILLKKEEEKLRQAVRIQHRPQPKKKKPDESHRGDASDDDTAVSLSAIKNRYMPVRTRAGGYNRKAIFSSNEDDDSDVEIGRIRKIRDKAKALKALCDTDSDESVEHDNKAKGEGGDKNSNSSSEDADTATAGSGREPSTPTTSVSNSNNE